MIDDPTDHNEELDEKSAGLTFKTLGIISLIGLIILTLVDLARQSGH